MVRSVGWKTIGLILLVHILATTFINFVFFKLEIVRVIPNATSGFINGTLVANILMGAMILPLLFYVGKLKLKDLALTPAAGFSEGGIFRGAIWTLAAIAIMHVAIVIACFASGTTPTIISGWLSFSAIPWIGNLLGQFFGNALYEEVLFRAFLLPQLLLAIKKKYRKWSWTKCFWLALIGSQLVFALIHIPNRLSLGAYTGVGSFIGDQLALFILGCLLASVFLLSRNIYAAIGIHAITNVPPLIIQNPIGGLQFTAYLTIGLIILYNRSKKPKK